MDEYNPLYEVRSTIPDISLELNQQNQSYGAQHWYPLIKNITPKSYFLELSDEDIVTLSKGDIPLNFYFKPFIEFLISNGYTFVKTTHKSAHAFKPIQSFEDFKDQITNANVIMSFRNYKCKFLMFRQWKEMSLECRCYIYNQKLRYIEVYRDLHKNFNPSMFQDIENFINKQVIPCLLNKYDSFTVDVFYLPENNEWNIVEINSPLWLKCGTYLIKYQWEKHRIHQATTPIFRYKNEENEIIEI